MLLTATQAKWADRLSDHHAIELEARALLAIKYTTASHFPKKRTIVNQPNRDLHMKISSNSDCRYPIKSIANGALHHTNLDSLKPTIYD